MASFNARQRDPLLDENTQAMVERRGKELLGLILLGLGLVLVAMLGSYTPDDPNWMVATDEPARNMLGRAGAAVSSTLIIILGYGAWTMPLLLAVWGGRFMLHRGAERAVSRAIFSWVFVVVASAYAATHVPGDLWTHSFGLGGLFGDTLMGAIIGVAPQSLMSAGLKISSFVLAIATLAVGLFTLGFNRAELQSIGRFLLLGSIYLYDGLVSGLRLVGLKSASGAAGLGSKLKSRAEARQARNASPLRRAPADDDLIEEFDAPPAYLGAERGAPPQGFAAPPRAPEAGRGLRARVEGLIRRAPEPELVEYAPPSGDFEAPSEDRIKARISDVIKAKAQAAVAAPPAPVGRSEPPVMRGQRAEVQIAPAVKTAVAAAQARAAAAAAMPKADPREAPMRLAVQPASSFTFEEDDDFIEPPKPQARVAPRLGGQTPARIESPMTAFAPQAPRAPVDYDDGDVYDDATLYGSEDAAEYRTLVAARADLSAGIEDDISGWEDEPEMTAAESLALVQPVQPAAPSRHVAYQPEADDDAEDDDGYEAWAAASAPAAAPLRQTPILGAAPQRVAAPAPLPANAPLRPAELSAKAASARDAAMRAQDYEAPPLSLLTNPAAIERHLLSDDALEENARLLENVLDDYGVKGEIVSVRPGPVVTMYELEPAPGLKASRVIGLADDIARSMSALSARVSTVPGRSVIGIELPNVHREKVVLREIIAARDFGDSNMRLPLALGKDIGGEPIIANLAKMPHLLIAGTTGSGKSVAINTMILSLLYKLTPEECRLIMIDPKMLELSVYDGIPHLLSPVVTDPKKAVVALKWVVGEMEERYRKMSKMGVRNIEGYNGRVREALAKGELFKRTVQTGFDEETGDPVFETDEFEPQPFPYIVVIVDEMADLMMVAGKEIEACIQRLAQMARASGIHLIMATQRPSVDVITGTIKANFPTRISFQVTSKIDSRTILGEMGAEQLLGMGDMLYMAGGGRISRIHGPFVSDEEVEEIVSHLKSFGPPTYMSGVVEGPDDERADDIDQVLGLGGGENSEDALYDQALAIVARDRKCSTSYIQRKLGIGYQKAARLVEQMEDQGVVSAANHVGKREILLPEH